MRVLKRTLEHPGSRPVAWLVMVAMLTVTWGVAPVRAQEQVARSVAILDFANDATGGALLGRAASAALAHKMTERNYTVRSRQEVIQASVQLGLREPYEPDEVRRLYREIDTELVIYGRILAVEQGDAPKPWARAVVRVEVYDGPSGEMVNGAIADGYETGTGTALADREATLNGAIEKACGAALERIEANSLIEGKVLVYTPVADPPKVLINRGSKYGVTKGMLFDIFRVILDPSDATRTTRIRVGRIKITSVSSDESEGIVLEAPQGIRTNDYLRQAFVFPSAEEMLPQRGPGGEIVAPPKPPKRGGQAGLLAGLLGTVAGVGALLLLLSMNNNTNRNAPRVNSNTGAYLSQSAPGANPSIVVEWSDRDFTPPRNFVGGYIIYRGPSENFAAVEADAVGAVAGAAQRRFSDDPIWREVNTTIPIRFSYQSGTDVEEVTEDLDITIIHESPQPGQTYFYKVRRLGPPSVITPPTLIETGQGGSSSGGGGLGGFGGGGGFFRHPNDSRARREYLRARAEGKLLVDGGNIRLRRYGRQVTHRQVASIPPGPNYDTDLDPAQDNDLAISSDIGLSDASAAVGPVTYIVPPDLRAPADNNQAQRVDDINFQWQGQYGATEYVLQIARNVNFSPLVFQSATLQNTAATLMSYAFNNTQSGFVTLAPNTTYFWRVGARTTFRNQRHPEPDGYVFSSVFTFATADQPPVAP